MTTSYSLLSCQANVSHHLLPPCLRAGLTCLEPLAARGRVVPSNLDIPHTSVSLSQAALLCIQTAATVHISASLTYVSSSIVRFRPSQNQLTPHEHNKGETFCQRRGRWDSTPQCMPRSKTKTPNSALFFPASFMFLLLSSSVFHLQLRDFHPSPPAFRTCLSALRFVHTPPFLSPLSPSVVSRLSCSR